MVGQTISNYQVIAKLGEGGMGVVYKALDLRLNRFLALKFIIPESSSTDRKRRFFQEAKAASALNHPNIIHVYDIGEWEGADYIAMEYVEGSTLQQALRKGGLSVDEALRFAIQVADALAAAHAAGIVHRDLKPGNVMLGPRGLVKILDFGLAKLKQPDIAVEAPAGSDSSDTRTLFEPAQTKAGAILGSPGYMSPEQVLGKPVDARSDIFAFGVLLYEMLTARQAFPGKARLEVFSAILHVDPPQPSGLNPAVNRELDWVIAHCLRKDPERRFQSMIEVKLALEDLRTGSISGAAPVAIPPVVRNKPRWYAGAVLGLGAAAVGSWLLNRKPAPVESTGPLEITRLTTEGGLSMSPAISPDGKLLAYASDRGGEGNLDIWVKQIGGGDAIRLTRDPADDTQPNFSPDGTKVVFRSGREGGGVYMVPALGGTEQKLVDGGRRPQFSPDGGQIAYWTGPPDAFPLRSGMGQIFVLDLVTLATRQIRADFAAAVHPVWSPDGKEILFLGLKDPADPYSFDWWITPVAGGGVPVKCNALKRRAFLNPFAWRDNRVFFSGGRPDWGGIRVGVVAFDPRTLQAVGEPRRLTAGTTDESSPSLSKDGRLVFASLTAFDNLYDLPLHANLGTAAGPLRRLTSGAAYDLVQSISAAGRQIAFISDRTGSLEVWGKDLVAGQERALTTGGKGGRGKTSAHITRDGGLVAWKVNGVNDRAIFVTPFGGGSSVQACADCGAPDAWAGGRKYLLFAGRESSRLWVGLLNLATGSHTEYMRDAQLGLRASSISGDGKWIAFNAYRTGREFTTYVAPFSPDRAPPPPEWVRIPLSALAHPNQRWSPDGNLLYFSSEQDGHACIWAQRLDPITKHPHGEPFAVQHFHSSSLRMDAPNFSEPIALAFDKIAVSLEARSGGIWMLKLQN